METNVTELLNYLYNNYAIAFIMCLLGSVLKDVMDGMNDTRTLSIKKIFVSTVFSSFLAGAASYWIKSLVHFGGYLFICLIIGMWGFWILKWVSDSSFAYLFLKNLLKNISSPIADAISEASSEIDEDKSNEKEDTEKEIKTEDDSEEKK